MPNMELKKSPMPVQDAYARICNFDEVALGYTYETAVNEAKRCLNCKHKPCVSGCPVEIDIPAFLAKVAAEDMEGAYEVLSRSTSLPAVCGRVCPQESQCEGKCVRGIKGDPVGIGRLERFARTMPWRTSARRKRCRKRTESAWRWSVPAPRD